eukprot:2128783-Prymnesium_polylepis.1
MSGLEVECAIGVSSFEVRSGAPPTDDVVIHCSGALHSALEVGLVATEYERARGRVCGHPAAVGGLYDSYNLVGLQYGPHYRTLAQAWVGSAAAAAQLQVRFMREGAVVHPADLDDALCVDALTSSSGDDGETRLPFAVDDARLQGGAGELWAVS